ncbi:MAG: CinA family protein [Anaerolineales bacterium]|jgi:PncC family amidohydrolase
MEAIEVTVGKALKSQGWTLGLAESCTGGLIAHRITNVPGSSDYFVGGVITYADGFKRAVLGVREETLIQHGAVSRPCALEMARGVLPLVGADVGVAVTGIAGPGGGSTEKPVGLTWIAVVAPGRECVERYAWKGSRQENKDSMADQALSLLLEVLEKQA